MIPNFARLQVARRSLHATPATYKSMKQSVTDAADTVNKKVGKALADGLEAGQKATEKTKDAFRNTAEEAKYKTNETSAQAGQKMNQAAAGAERAKQDVKEELRK